MAEKDYDSTIARMAGNIAAGIVSEGSSQDPKTIAQAAIYIAEEIVLQLKAKRLEPPA